MNVNTHRKHIFPPLQFYSLLQPFQYEQYSNKRIEKGGKIINFPFHQHTRQHL